MFRRKRRRGRRVSAGWLGRYVPAESSGHEMVTCHVLDVSSGGAGLELPGAGDQAGARVGDRVVVDLQLVRSNIGARHAHGRGAAATRIPVGVHVGMRFVDVGELERALLDRLVARQKHERRNPGVVTPLEQLR